MATKISGFAQSWKGHFAVWITAIALGALSGCAGSPAKESTGEFFDDSAITTKVKTALLEEKGVSSTNISVSTFKGKVQLSGFVKSGEEKQKAEHAAASVGGVKSVVNDLVVK